MKYSRTITFIAQAAFLLTANPALAHAMLVTAIPGVGSTVSAVPRQIRLTFTEGVEPVFCHVSLTSASGAIEKTGKPQVNPSQRTVLVVPILAALKPGSYTVSWQVVSVDTHRTQGAFDFTFASELKPRSPNQ